MSNLYDLNPLRNAIGRILGYDCGLYLCTNCLTVAVNGEFFTVALHSHEVWGMGRKIGTLDEDPDVLARKILWEMQK